MAFDKGTSGNPNGRKPGTANKTTQSVREKFAQLLDGYEVEQLRADLMAIQNPKDRLSILLGLAEFVTPKLARTVVTATVDSSPAVFHILPASQHPPLQRQSLEQPPF
jgi:hypothetical protein